MLSRAFPCFIGFPTQRRGFLLTSKRLSYTRALETVRKLLKSIGLKPELYGLHSMRSGGASLAVALGLPDHLIMRHGGWRSESSKNVYIKETKAALLDISKSFKLFVFLIQEM